MPLVHLSAHRTASAAVAVAAAGVLSAGLVLTGSTSLGRAAELVPATTAPAAGATPQTATTPAEPAAPPATAAAASTGSRSRVAPLAARLRADVLVAAGGSLDPAVLRRLRELTADDGASYRSGTVRVSGKAVAAVGVDPSAFRRYAAKGTAEAAGVWQAVASGEAVASHAAAERLGLELGQDVVVRGRDGSPVVLRLGALATTGLPGTDLLVGDAVGGRLGLPANALLLSADKGSDPVALARSARSVTGGDARVDLLTAPAANPVAFLTGSRAAQAFGAFSYRYFADGTIQPDARWVSSNIVTADVPVLGRVTCHRLMVEQLRSALAEVEARGLSGSLHTYDGCYVPRFIERNPGGSISLHTWGIAIDLDASTNYRGIRGTMDPAVVEIFKRWGFRWGGDWQYTDPMHFELGAILE